MNFRSVFTLLARTSTSGIQESHEVIDSPPGRRGGKFTREPGAIINTRHQTVTEPESQSQRFPSQSVPPKWYQTRFQRPTIDLRPHWTSVNYRDRNRQSRALAL